MFSGCSDDEAVEPTFDARGWRVVIISVRDPQTDFRRDLATALRRIGAEAVYIRVGRRCFVDDGAPSSGKLRSPFFVLAQTLSLDAGKCFLLLSVNTGVPFFSIVMRLLSFRTIWLFDEHDDLLYGARGIGRAIERMKLELLRGIASRSVCVSPNLSARVVGSALIPNASAVRRISRSRVDVSKAVILSNIDERFDFRFVRHFMAAAPSVQIHVFGAASGNPAVTREFAALQAAGTVIHHGSYRNDEIQGILDGFGIMLVPYLLDASTFFIDPLRFYHGLNNGLEIVSSKIPRAGDMQDRLHLVEDGTEAAYVIDALRDGQRQPKNRGAFPPLTWEDRAYQFLCFAEALRTRGRFSD